MIHHKKLRWERQKQELDNRLNLREQEFENQKTTLEQKNNEVESLKKLLDKMEMSTQEIMKKYENEINLLNDQVSELIFE
jgi:chromosome segregation ATPase